MDTQKRFRIPVTAIALDLVGCLLIALGVLSLSGLELTFLSSVPGDHNPGWTLVVFGIVFVTAATMIIIGVVLAHRGARETPPTVD